MHIRYSDWTARTPLVTRSLLQALGASYLLSWFVGTDLILANIPFYAVLRFEVYRVLLSPFSSNSLLTLVFSFICFTSVGVWTCRGVNGLAHDKRARAR